MAQLSLWLISFSVGGAVMVIELVGARLLAPTFGASVVPWTAAIAVVLLGVALGNAWGGGRSRTVGPGTLRLLLLLAGSAALLPMVRMGLPDVLLGWLGMAGGSVVAGLLFFFPAAFLMGAVVPILVRFATTELEEVGRRAGTLNGANAVGAITGTLLTGFVLIPLLPVSFILAATAVWLFGAAALVRSVEGRR